LAPAVEAAARPQLVEVGRLARKYWAGGAVGDVVVGDLEGFYWLGGQEVVGASLVELLEGFVWLLAGELVYLVEVVQGKVGYLSLASLLRLLLVWLLSYQVLEGSPLCSEVSDFIPELRRLNFIRLQWVALLLRQFIRLLFPCRVAFREILDFFDDLLHLICVLLIHCILCEPVVDDTSFDV
jgi:hypothetical protein